MSAWRPEERSPKRRQKPVSAEAAREIAALEGMLAGERYLDSQIIGHWPRGVCKAC